MLVKSIMEKPEWANELLNEFTDLKKEVSLNCTKLGGMNEKLGGMNEKLDSIAEMAQANGQGIKTITKRIDVLIDDVKDIKIHITKT